MPLLRQPRHLAPERRTLESVRPLELYFDLVFVLGFTQCIILALGESIVALGIGAEVGLTVGVITAAALGIGLASALWWIYFDSCRW